MKYIMVTDEKGVECPILFPDSLTHRQIASCHSATRGPRVISAGFYTVNDDNVGTAYGESETLGRLGARPEDSLIITAFLAGKHA
jgi:hypothetical protein